MKEDCAKRKTIEQDFCQEEVVVGVLSDTHGILPKSAIQALVGSDWIIHAGDIGDQRILDRLELIAPIFAVLGNNDFDEYDRSITRFAYPHISGVRFLVAHYPEDVQIKAFTYANNHASRPLPHVCIHGHTHVPRIVSGRDAGLVDYIICPGSTSYPRKGSRPSVAKIIIKEQRVSQIFIQELY